METETVAPKRKRTRSTTPKAPKEPRATRPRTAAQKTGAKKAASKRKGKALSPAHKKKISEALKRWHRSGRRKGGLQGDLHRAVGVIGTGTKRAFKPHARVAVKKGVHHLLSKLRSAGKHAKRYGKHARVHGKKLFTPRFRKSVKGMFH
jgi:hypothetical protein